MYREGDWIVYGSAGPCQVLSVEKSDGGMGLERGKTYYKLSPLLDSSVIFAPVDTKVFMRPVLTRREATELLEGIPTLEWEAYGGGSIRIQTERYKEAFASHDCGDLLRLIRGVYEKNRACAENGKRPGQLDLRYKKRAEELLHSELSVALGIPYGQMQSYIEETVRRVEAAVE